MSRDGVPVPDAGFGVAMAERVRPRSRAIARRAAGAAPGRLAGRMVDFASAMGVAPLARLDMEQGTLAAPAGASVRPPLDPWLWGPDDEPVETHAATPWQPARSTVRRTPRRGLPLTTRRGNRTVGGAGTAPGAIARRIAPGADAAPADPAELIARSRGRVAATRSTPAPAATRPQPAAPAPAEPAGGLPSDLERLRRMLIRDGKLNAPIPGEMPPPPGRPDLRPATGRLAPDRPAPGSAPPDGAPMATEARVSAAGSIDRATVARRARPEADPIRRSQQADAVGRDTAPAPGPGRGRATADDPSTRPPSTWLGDDGPSGGVTAAPAAASSRSGSVDPAALASVIRRRAARPQPSRPVTSQPAPGMPGGAARAPGLASGHADPAEPGALRAGASVAGAAAVRHSPVTEVIAERRPVAAGPVGLLEPDRDVRTDPAAVDASRSATSPVDTRDAAAAFPDSGTTEWAVAPPPLAPAEDSPGARGPGPVAPPVEPAPTRRSQPPVVRRLAEVAPSVAEVRAAPDRPNSAPRPDGSVAPARPAASPPSPSPAEGRVATQRSSPAPSPADARVAADRSDVPASPAVAPTVAPAPPDAREGSGGRDTIGPRAVDTVSSPSAPGIPIEELPVRPAVASPGAGDATIRRRFDATSMSTSTSTSPSPGGPDSGMRPQPASAVLDGQVPVTAADLRRVAARADRPVPLSRDQAAAAIASTPGRRVVAADLTAPASSVPNATTAAGFASAPSTASLETVVRRAVIGDAPSVGSPGGLVTSSDERPATTVVPPTIVPSTTRRAAAVPASDLSVRMAVPAGPPTAVEEAGRVTRGVLRRTVADMPLRRRHEPLAAAVAGAAAREDTGVIEQLAGGDGRDAPIAERFMTELSRRRTPRPAPLPERLRPMSDLITGGVTARVATDRISRQALRSVGKVAATVGDTIHLDRPVHQVRTEVLAHELTHVAHPSPAPRFFDDDRPSIEERRADAIGKLMRSTAPSVIRRAPADDAPGPGATSAATSAGTVSAAALADQLTSGRGGATIRRWNTATPSGTSRSGAPATTDRSRGRGSGGAPSTPPAQQAVAPPPPPPAVVAAPEPAEVSAPDLVSQFDRILELLEERVLRELERRGGRLRGGF